MFKSGSVDGLSLGKMPLQIRIAILAAVILKGMSLVLQIQLVKKRKAVPLTCRGGL
jgi:hypothetical protein